MLDICCDRCGNPLNEPGALMFGPPALSPDHTGYVVSKLHVCVACWPSILATAKPEPMTVPESYKDTILKCLSLEIDTKQLALRNAHLSRYIGEQPIYGSVGSIEQRLDHLVAVRDWVSRQLGGEKTCTTGL